MRAEALEAPAAAARLLAGGAPLAALAESLRAAPPRALLTLARGSSDHAAHYFAYLAMSRLGRLVTSLPPSLITLHGARLDTAGLVALAFSQSGRSPDLVEPIVQLRAAGARTAALVNDASSPLAAAAEWLQPLRAGPEASVAATKSFVAQLVAGALLVARWEGSAALLDAVGALPAPLQAAAALGAAGAAAAVQAAAPLVAADRMVVVGRGTGLALALEVALKLKETCGIQAEAFSGAELRHGPLALVQPGYPVLVLAPRGPAQTGLLALADDLRRCGAMVLLAAPPDARSPPGPAIPLVPAAHEDLDPIVATLPLYLLVEALARARGRDPDAPPHLAKVTETR
jgi:glucosamine--fructose-6-phosphate aminotransferase (isomerizing)